MAEQLLHACQVRSPPILPVHVCRAQQPPKRGRQRRQPLLTTPRRSVRLAKGAGRSTATTKQQQVIIRKLCLAHEGDTIGDEALQAYIRLSDNLLTDGQIAAILALFGWESPAAPMLGEVEAVDG